MTTPAASSRSVAALAALQTALFAVPMIVLGRAIGWPASLRLPPAEILPLIHAQAAAVQAGYWAYLLVSVALVPLAFAFRSWFAQQGLSGPWMDAAAFVGGAAGVLKTLGIVRWLIAMPTLAQAHADAADPVLRQTIETVALGLNGYGGSVGELLGVQLMSGIWLVAVGLGLIRLGRPLVGAWGLGAGVLFLLLCARTVLPAVAGLQAIAVPVALLWFLALAGSLLRRPAR